MQRSFFRHEHRSVDRSSLLVLIERPPRYVRSLSQVHRCSTDSINTCIAFLLPPSRPRENPNPLTALAPARHRCCEQASCPQDGARTSRAFLQGDESRRQASQKRDPHPAQQAATLPALGGPAQQRGFLGRRRRHLPGGDPAETTAEQLHQEAEARQQPRRR